MSNKKQCLKHCHRKSKGFLGQDKLPRVRRSLRKTDESRFRWVIEIMTTKKQFFQETFIKKKKTVP